MTTSAVRRLAVRLGIGAASIAALVYLGAIGYLMARETDLVFPRVVVARGLPAPADSLHLPYRDVRVRTADSVTLDAWIVPAAREDSSGMWILLCHGQTGNVATTTRPEYYRDLRAIGVNILAFDWRGFGASGGAPSEAGLYRDATAAYRYLRDELRVPPERIVIFGHSLGTAPAIELATRAPAAGLVVEGAPRSVRERGQEVYPYLPVRLVARTDFNSLARIGRVRMPILFLHARADRTIPIAHARALLAAAMAPARLVELAGGHPDAFQADSARYFGEYARFVREVERR